MHLVMVKERLLPWLYIEKVNSNLKCETWRGYWIITETKPQSFLDHLSVSFTGKSTEYNPGITYISFKNETKNEICRIKEYISDRVGIRMGDVVW